MLTSTIKGMLAHKLRLFLTATSIALGVAFLAGTLILNSSMQRAFDELFASVNAGTDTVVRAESDTEAAEQRAPLPAGLLDAVEAVDGVGVAEGRVEGYALLTDAQGKPIQPAGAPTLGGNLSVDPALRGDVVLRTGRAPDKPGEVAIDATSAAEGGLGIGSRTKILFQGPAETFTVVGIVGYGDADDLGGSTAAYFELETAQRLLGNRTSFDTIVATAADGTSAAELTDRVAAVLPSGYEALTGDAVAEEAAASVKESLGFMTIALMVFAGIAIFVGSFIIWNTFSCRSRSARESWRCCGRSAPPAVR